MVIPEIPTTPPVEPLDSRKQPVSPAPQDRFPENGDNSHLELLKKVQIGVSLEAMARVVTNQINLDNDFKPPTSDEFTQERATAAAKEAENKITQQLNKQRQISWDVFDKAQDSNKEWTINGNTVVWGSANEEQKQEIRMQAWREAVAKDYFPKITNAKEAALELLGLKVNDARTFSESLTNVYDAYFGEGKNTAEEIIKKLVGSNASLAAVSANIAAIEEFLDTVFGGEPAREALRIVANLQTIVTNQEYVNVFQKDFIQDTAVWQAATLGSGSETEKIVRAKQETYGLRYLAEEITQPLQNPLVKLGDQTVPKDSNNDETAITDKTIRDVVDDFYELASKDPAELHQEFAENFSGDNLDLFILELKSLRKILSEEDITMAVDFLLKYSDMISNLTNIEHNSEIYRNEINGEDVFFTIDKNGNVQKFSAEEQGKIASAYERVKRVIKQKILEDSSIPGGGLAEDDNLVFISD